MRHVDLVGGPSRRAVRLLVRGRQPASEEGQLIAEMAFICGFHVAGIIPPFRLVREVGPVVGREVERSRPFGLCKARRIVRQRDKPRLHLRLIAA